MTEKDIQQIADAVFKKMEEQRDQCSLTPEEQRDIKMLLKTKKKTIKVVMAITIALIIWGIKSAVESIVGHIKWG